MDIQTTQTTPANPATPATSQDIQHGVQVLLGRNRSFAATDARQQATPLPFVPRELAYVITCIDPRVDPGQILGVGIGDAIVARSVGGRVNDAVINDMAWISYLKETIAPDEPFFEVAVIHHTDCGSALMADDRLRTGFAERNHLDATARDALLDVAVTDPHTTVRHDVERLLASPDISPRIRVSGHVYDVTTGLVTTIAPATNRQQD
ncbi:carbonic anhydrase [Jatrophihabitans lederbergiae]|uniref:carbonic anhydrase n=1 Tax=Jatrophihabitans lederbergiae TaxID=3075547 RepID=A0ABU2JF88_9ACTN|nr:carbonic anhydrase [Jatrophihabitans sp. DSM 44399]MDT0263349.1 carbonic anhydrase [Jatrophihabitans sp. DSM 44399]